MNCRSCTLVVVFAGLTGVVAGQGDAPDWPQWRGPNRDGSVASFTPPKVWPERLNQKWKVDVGLGHATPLVVANRVYIFSRRGDDEVMAALAADSGKLLWQTGYPVQFTMDKAAAPHGPGPKSTPAFADGKLYALGMTGIVSAFDAAAGKLLWQTPAPGNMLLWTSNSFSPIVDRGLVVVHVGGNDKGALTAFDAATGDVKWIWRDDGPAYGSPIVADLAGTRQIVTMTQRKFIGVDAATGALLWEQPYMTEYAQNIITPVQNGQTLIVSGYQKPVTAFAVTRQKDRWAIQTLWENPDVSLYMSDAVLAGETIIGFSQRRSGQFFGLGSGNREDAVAERRASG
jgi:outer membrane protein assembly factor BamB